MNDLSNTSSEGKGTSDVPSIDKENISIDLSTPMSEKYNDAMHTSMAPESSTKPSLDADLTMLAFSSNSIPDRSLSLSVALKLIKIDGGLQVALHPDKFIYLDKEVAIKLFKNGYRRSVVEHLEKYKGLDHREIVRKLIEEHYDGWTVIKNLEKFTDLNEEEIAHMLIRAGKGDAVAKYLEKFTCLDHKEIARKLIKSGQGKAVAEYLEKFTGLDKEDLLLVRRSIA